MKILNLKECPEYLTILAEWHHNEWSYLYPDQTLNDRVTSMQQYLDNNLIPSTYVAMEDGSLLGSAALIKHDMDTRLHLTPWLASVYVAPQFRKKGIGSRLVTHVTDEAKKAGITNLYLFTPDQEDFYKRLGWKPYDEEHYYGKNVTIMELNLLNED